MRYTIVSTLRTTILTVLAFLAVMAGIGASTATASTHHSNLPAYASKAFDPDTHRGWACTGTYDAKASKAEQARYWQRFHYAFGNPTHKIVVKGDTEWIEPLSVHDNSFTMGHCVYAPHNVRQWKSGIEAATYRELQLSGGLEISSVANVHHGRGLHNVYIVSDENESIAFATKAEAVAWWHHGAYHPDSITVRHMNF